MALSSRIPRRLSSVTLTARRAARPCATSTVFVATPRSSAPLPPPCAPPHPPGGNARSAPSAPPATRYFNPPDEEGEDYKGGRDLAALKKFASTELGPGCSVDTIENCDADQKKELEKYIAMPAEERAAKLEELKKALSDGEEEHNALLKQLQATFKESQEKLEKLKEDAAPQIKLLKAATPGPAKAGGKDEV